MDFFFQALTVGMIKGAVYVIIALSMVIIYKSSRVFNFAVGEFCTLGGIFFLVASRTELPLILVFVIFLVLCMAGGAILEKIVIQPLMGRDPLSTTLTTIGLSIFLVGLYQITLGTHPQSLDVSLPDLTVEVGDLFFTSEQIWSSIFAVASLIALLVFLSVYSMGHRHARDGRRTGQGHGFRDKHALCADADLGDSRGGGSAGRPGGCLDRIAPIQHGSYRIGSHSSGSCGRPGQHRGVHNRRHTRGHCRISHYILPGIGHRAGRIPCCDSLSVPAHCAHDTSHWTVRGGPHREGVGMLKVENLTVVYFGVISVLHGVSLEAKKGVVTALLGGNGSGKSTLMRAISGILPVFEGEIQEGEIRLDDVKLNKLKSVDITKQVQLTYLMEGRPIFEYLTVKENLKAAANCRWDSEVPADIERVLDYFPVLRQRLKFRSGYLSGGEQQMLAVGMAVMTNPRFLLLDEPSLGLAPLMVNEIFTIIKRIHKEHGIGILLSEQNAIVALKISSVRLCDG